MRPYTSRAGQRFGRLLVLDLPPRRDGSRHVTFLTVKCDCGVTKEVNSYSLKQGSIHSCGCLRSQYTSIRQSKTLIPNGVAARRGKFCSYRWQSLRRAFQFDLSYEQFEILSKSNCYYCGCPPSQEARARNSICIYNGIDRKDNSIGYTADNSVPCCGTCNAMKSDLGYEEFVAHVSKITRYLGLSEHI